MVSASAPSDGDNIKQAGYQLLRAYRETRQRGEQLDSVNHALVRHAVAVSSRKAANRTTTSVNNVDDLADRLNNYAKAATEEDQVGRAVALGYANLQKIVLWIIGGGAALFLSTYIIPILIAVIGAIAASAATAVLLGFGAATLGLVVFLVRTGPLILATIEGYFNTLGETWNSTEDTQRVLANTLDSHEQQFFALIGGPRPRRPLIYLLGPATALLLAIPGIILVLGILIGIYNATFQRPECTLHEYGFASTPTYPCPEDGNSQPQVQPSGTPPVRR